MKLKGVKKVTPQISHQYQCIFIHIPKAAGTTIETSGIFYDQRQATGKNVAGHLNAIGFKEKFPNEFENYFKFTFVRNPFDRLVSAFYYFNKGGSNNDYDKAVFEKHFAPYKDNFRGFCLDWLSEDNIQKVVHLKPQIDFIHNENGENMVDFIGKVESFSQDFELVCKKLGFPHFQKVSKKRRSKHKDYSTYYTSEMLSRVASVYEEDLSVFNYKYDNSKLRVINKEFENFGLSLKENINKMKSFVKKM